MKSFTKAYVKYLQETPKKGGRPYSPVTIRNRSYMVDRLKEPITLESVNTFIKNNIKHQSMARAMGHFLCFYLYGKIDKTLLKKVGDKLYIPPEQAKQYTHWEKVLTEEEKEKLCTQTKEPFPVIFRFLFDTMLRKSEFLSIKVEDIDFDKNSVVLQRIKGGNPDLRFFHGTTKQMLVSYLEKEKIKKGLIFGLSQEEIERIKKGSKSSKNKFSNYTFWYRVNQVAKETINKKFNPHWIRSTEAQQMRDMGADDFSMMQRGGWKDRSVLDVYSRSSVVSKKKAFDNFSKEVK